MKRFGMNPVLRRTLIGVTALAGGVGVIVAITAKEWTKSPRPGASSAVLVPATAPTDSARSTDEPAEATPAPTAAELPNAAAEDPVPAEESASPAPPSPTAATAHAPPTATSEASGSSIRIKIANPRPGLHVTVDGRPTSLPVRLPRDQKAHVLAFTAPNFKLETKTVVADQDRTLTLDYRPKLYVP
jgi:hypothetical protein